ncbi:MAG: glycine dehydrogenase (aminomethyl-transferring) [Planctomycetales bacterium 4484_113]|nr:MAG: glycine dehydrogenase (aminomethyl-transferring) [Planctomycetales bacterium 4484_113]
MSKLIFERSSPGRRGPDIADTRGIETASPYLSPELRREQPLPLPEVSEIDVVRHYTELSRKNFGVDIGFYPLGSCTMKYNPKLNEEIASWPEFAELHPYQSEDTVQGALRVMWELSEDLSEIAGMDAVSLQPAAGAHGELTGMLMFRRYFNERGENRPVILIPDSGHGTNPASATIAGFRVREVVSNKQGMTTVSALKQIAAQESKDAIAGIMMTNPNTLGLFEREISEVAGYLHEIGALLYYDGANLNALLGYARPGDMGFDVVHFNLHKTFSTPHGGGGPGSGPVAAKGDLADYLPSPLVRRVEDASGNARFTFTSPTKSIGRMKLFYGNFLVLVKALVYTRQLGSPGLRRVAENSVLNANYVQERLKDAYDIPYYQRCMHEFVVSARRQKAESGVTAKDIGKKLLSSGVHAPTTYFPLIVPEALMIEPTETESLQTLDDFCDLMLAFAEEIRRDPEGFKVLKNLPVHHLDEVTAARHPDVCWGPKE